MTVPPNNSPNPPPNSPDPRLKDHDKGRERALSTPRIAQIKRIEKVVEKAVIVEGRERANTV